MERIVFLDTEATGLDFNNNQILQLSYIICDSKLNIVNSKNFYLDVDAEIEEGASAIHKITKEKNIELSQGRKFNDVAFEIYWDLNNSKVICHNTDFDLSFIKKEFSRLDENLDIKDSFCTMKYYKDVLKIKNAYGYKWPKLEEVIDFLKLDKKQLLEESKKVFNTNDNIEFHDARLDIYSTYVIYKEMLEENLDKLKRLISDTETGCIENIFKAIYEYKIIDFEGHEMIDFDEGESYFKAFINHEYYESMSYGEYEVDRYISILTKIKEILRKFNPHKIN